MTTTKKFFSYLFDTFLFSSLFISCVATLMAANVYEIFGFETNRNYLLFVFFSTMASYNLHLHFTQHVKVEHLRVPWSLSHRGIHLILFLISIAVASFFALQLLDHWFELGVAVLLTFLYTAPKLPFKSLRWLKNVAVGKTIFLSFVWTYVTTVLPLLTSGTGLNSAGYLFIAGRFFFIYAACIVFDYRDREQDREEGIRSMITYFSEKGVIVLFYFSIVLALFFFFFCYLSGMAPGVLILQAVPCFILPFLFNKARKNFSDYLYSFWVDGMLALPAMLYYLID